MVVVYSKLAVTGLTGEIARGQCTTRQTVDAIRAAANIIARMGEKELLECGMQTVGAVAGPVVATPEQAAAFLAAVGLPREMMSAWQVVNVGTFRKRIYVLMVPKGVGLPDLQSGPTVFCVHFSLRTMYEEGRISEAPSIYAGIVCFAATMPADVRTSFLDDLIKNGGGSGPKTEVSIPSLAAVKWHLSQAEMATNKVMVAMPLPGEQEKATRWHVSLSQAMGAPEGFQVQAFQQAYYSFQGHPQAPEAPASFQVAMSQGGAMPLTLLGEPEPATAFDLAFDLVIKTGYSMHQLAKLQGISGPAMGKFAGLLQVPAHQLSSRTMGEMKSTIHCFAALVGRTEPYAAEHYSKAALFAWDMLQRHVPCLEIKVSPRPGFIHGTNDTGSAGGMVSPATGLAGEFMGMSMGMSTTTFGSLAAPGMGAIMSLTGPGAESPYLGSNLSLAPPSMGVGATTYSIGHANPGMPMPASPEMMEMLQGAFRPESRVAILCHQARGPTPAPGRSETPCFGGLAGSRSIYERPDLMDSLERAMLASPMPGPVPDLMDMLRGSADAVVFLRSPSPKGLNGDSSAVLIPTGHPAAFPACCSAQANGFLMPPGM